MRFPTFLYLLLLVTGIGLSQTVVAQTEEIQLANQYYQNGELAKAAVLYDKAVGSRGQFPAIYGNYLQTLLGLKRYKDAEKLVKRAIKEYPGIPQYEVELGLVAQRSGNVEQAKKLWDKIVQNLNPNLVIQTASAFQNQDLLDYAERTYLQGRKLLKNEQMFSGNLIGLYVQQRNTPKLIEEVLSMASQAGGNLNYAQNMLQNYLKEDKDFDALETVLLSRVQKNPEQTNYSELLIWLYTQRKDFFNALIQAKSVDKRLHQEGQRVMDLGQISLKNKDYESAIEAFEYVVREYKGGPNYPMARQKLINAREEQVKTTFPVDKAKIIALIGDYNNLLAELGRTPQTVTVLRNMAQLHAFYLDDRSKAVELLQEITNTPRANPDLIAESKLLLGDIYVLKQEPWEATLLYSQVEKSHKDAPLGHEAKLRNAKLSYYKGEFELAQEHLDVLKLATSREIAHHAMDLSILITDNMGLDTTPYAMQDYARADLLIFQTKYLQAQKLLDSMLIKYPGHSLTDDIYFQKATLYQKVGDFPSALKNLEQITAAEVDVLSDDALFLTAKITEENLKDKAKAQELYSTLLTKFPGSLYVVDARKRFRKLRGDAISQ